MGKSSIDRFRAFLDFIGPKAVRYIISGVMAAISLVIVDLILAISLQKILFHILTGSAERSLQFLGTTLDLMAAVLVTMILGSMRGILRWAQDRFSAFVYAEFEHLQRQRICLWIYSQATLSTETATRLFLKRVDEGALYIRHLQVVLITAIFGISILAILVALSWKLTAILLSCLVPVAFLVLYQNRGIKSHGTKVSNCVSRLNERIIRNIRNILLLRIYGTKAVELEISKREVQAAYSEQKKFFSEASIPPALLETIGVLALCITIYLMGGVENKQANLIPYSYMFLRFVQNLIPLSNSLSFLNFTRSPYLELRHWWEAHRGISEIESRTSPCRNVYDFEGPIAWKVENLSFSYGNSPRLFTRVSLDFESAKIHVVKGPSGCGKTTLAWLLAGELFPTEGSVSVRTTRGWVPIEMAREGLRQHLGYVGASPFLVEGTLRENLLYGLGSIVNDNKLLEALKAAQCDFVEDLSALDRHITDQGDGLSAGQKQRLNLARALLRTPKALILDEPTSNLDAETERRLFEQLRKMKASTTILLVSHREAALDIADQVISF